MFDQLTGPQLTAVLIFGMIILMLIVIAIVAMIADVAKTRAKAKSPVQTPKVTVNHSKEQWPNWPNYESSFVNETKGKEGSA